MPNVTIDAGVLAAPPPACNSDDVFQYVDTLLDWKKLLNEPWISIYMSENASDALFADELYPLREHLTELFRIHNVVEYTVNDIAKIVTQLLTTTPSFEDHYRVKDVLVENFETDPDIIKSVEFSSIQSDLIRCLTLIAILRHYCLPPHNSHSLIVHNAPTQCLKIRTQIHDIEHDRDDFPVFPEPPEFFDGDVVICDQFHDFIDGLDEIGILIGASDDSDVELSVRIALFKDVIEQKECLGWDDILIPIFGADFRKTCQRCCTDQASSLPPKILRSIIETVNGQNLPAVHALRTGPGGGNPQLMRGGDKAQRRDIDSEFHLHYWVCANGDIELASVVYHNDFSIRE